MTSPPRAPPAAGFHLEGCARSSPPPSLTIVRCAINRQREAAAILAVVDEGCGLLFFVAFEFAVKGGVAVDIQN